MGTLARVQFVVEDFGDDPAEVTRLIGFEPTGIATHGFSSLPMRRSWWFELSGMAPEDITEHLALLVRFLETNSQNIQSVARQFRTRIAIILDDRDWIWPYDPAGPRIGSFDLPPTLITVLGKLGIGVTIQVSCGLDAETKQSPTQE